MPKYFISCLLSLILFNHCFCQNKEASFTQYSVNEGLSQNSVYCIIQDSSHFLWLGTADGLNKFDAYSFTTYKKDPNQSLGLSNNTIRGFYIDKKRQLWIGTEDGLNLYDPLSNTIKKITLPDLSEIHNKAILPLGQNGDQLYLWRRSEGIVIYDVKKHTLKLLSSAEKSIVESTAAMDAKDVWLATHEHKLCNINFISGKISYQNLKLPKETKIFGLRKFNKDSLIICTSNGIWNYSIAQNKLIRLIDKLKNKSVIDVIKSSEGITYVAILNEGINTYDPNWNLIESYNNEHRFISSNGYSLKHIIRFYQDCSNNIWLGTDGDGAFMISKHQIKFHLASKSNSSDIKLSTNFIKCFYEDSNQNLYVGTLDQGIICIDKTRTKIQYYTNNEHTNESLPSNIINNINGAPGGLWIGTEKGMCYFSFQTKKFTRIKIQSQLADQRIICAKTLSNGKLLVSSQGYLFTLNKNKELIRINNKIILAAKCIYDNHEDVILGTESNGFRILRSNNLLKPNCHENKNIIHTSFQCFLKSKDKIIWAATDIGLMKFNLNYDLLKIYNIKSGLPDNYIYGIEEDEKGHLWLSTNKGLSQFNPQKESFKNYTTEDGLQSNEYNTGAFYQSKSGELFFGGVNGFNYFYPSNITINPHTPKIQLTEFKIFDEVINLDTSILLKKYIELPYNKNTISFEFSALEFSNPKQNKYASKLEGLEDKWYYSSGMRQVRYSSLEPGIYTLYLKASNNDELWSAPTQIIKIKIKAPYWKTWWFLSFIGIIILAFIYGVLRFFINRKLEKKLIALERRNEIEKIRNRISRDIHDDIGSGLTKISMISHLASLEIKDNKDINDKLQHLSKSARDLTERLQEIIWAMNPRNDDLKSLIAFLRAYAYEYFENSSIGIIIEFPNEIPDHPLNPDERRNLFLCFKEALNNILKHSEATEVCLKIEILQNVFHLWIVDNGKGINEEINQLNSQSFKNGNGLNNMKKRLEEIGGNLNYINEKGNGLAIHIQFPIHIST